jgi:hypothetical protein
MPTRNQREIAAKLVIGTVSGTGLLAVISSLTASQRFVFTLFPVPPVWNSCTVFAIRIGNL